MQVNLKTCSLYTFISWLMENKNSWYDLQFINLFTFTVPIFIFILKWSMPNL